MAFSEDELSRAVGNFELYLRGRQLKTTEQRRTMVRAALEQDGHFTAEDLYRALTKAGENVSMATVYRGLTLLEEAKLIEGHDFADGLRRYERALEREHHDHMICVDCRAVLEFSKPEIERIQQEVVASHGFELQDHSLTLFVKCKAWREKGECEIRRRRMTRKGDS